MRSLSLLLVVLSFFASIECRKFKILFFTPRFAHSHTTFMGKIADALVEAGHDVTVFLPEISKNVKTNGTRLAKTITMPPAERVTKQFEGDLYFMDSWTAPSQDPFAQRQLMEFVADTMAMQCEELVKHDEIFERFRKEKFDLGIVETFDMCGLGFFEQIGIKTHIVTSSTILFDGLARAIGVPSPPSYVPSSFSTSGESMTFFERISNFITLYYVGYHFHDRTKLQEERFYREQFGSVTDFDELIARAPIVLTNNDPIIDFGRPLLHKVVSVGGIGVPTPQKLNPFWDEVMNRREKAVLISFGSFAQSYVMPAAMKAAIKNMMRRFPEVTFVWKYENEDDNIAEDVPNLVAKAWVPQNDLLNHPKLATFITHAGMNSIIEASNRGVPLITIPLFGEQLRNAKMTKKLGTSVLLNKEGLFDADAMEAAINEILRNDDYRKTATRVAEMIKKRPTPIKQNLVKNVEFAAEFGEMPSYDIAGRKMSWFVNFSVDVLLAIALAFLALSLLSIALIVKITRVVIEFCKILQLAYKRSQLGVGVAAFDVCGFDFWIKIKQFPVMASNPADGAQGQAQPQGLQPRPMLVVRELAESNYFHNLVEIGPIPPVVEAQQEPGRTGREVVTLLTNAYGIGFEDGVPIYRYDVNCIGRLRGRDLHIEFTKRSPDDAVALNRRDKCRRLLDLVIERNPEFFGQRHEYYWYDLQHILFTKNLLNVPNDSKREFVFEREELTGEPLFEGLQQVMFSISPVSESFMITLGDLSRFVTPDLTQMDHGLQQFLEILTSQHALRNPEEAVCYGSSTAYLMHPEQHGFTQDDCPPLGDGKYLGIGCAKSVRFVEGPKGRGSKKAALVVDLKKTAFHATTTVLEKAQMIVNRENIQSNDIGRLRNLKGLTVETRYGRVRRFTIQGFTPETATEKKFTNREGVEVSLVDYFISAYNINLRYPNSPLLTAKVRGTLAFYPLELCHIVDGQRVSESQQTPMQVQKMIRQCAVPPADRVRQIGNLIRSLVLTSDNIYHRAAGITITEKPLQVRGRLLANPTVIYGGNTAATPDGKANWRLDRSRQPFLKPAKITKWTMITIKGNNRNDVLNPAMLNNFARMLVGECRARGMEMSDPSPEPCFINPARQELINTMEAAKEGKLEFVFFITNSDITDMHHPMKLLERKLGVITQDLRMSTAFDVVQKNKRLTLENIVNKTNMKNGGLNYTLRIAAPQGKNILPPRRLIIGFSMCHSKFEAGDPPAQRNPRSPPIPETPSVLGIASNSKKDPLDFVGDCIFQPPKRDERIGMLQPLLRTIINEFEENRGAAPTEIIIYRNGGSEGQYRDILDLEVVMVRSVAQSVCGPDVKITMIVSQKLHNLRLGSIDVNSKDKPSDQNVRPGTVVDSQIVHPAYSEFYLNSHVALQGSARTPRYTVLYDDLHMTLDELEALTYNLCFAHQIVNLTTSLPAPIYIAGCYAERGHNLYVAQGCTFVKGDTPQLIAAPEGFSVATLGTPSTPIAGQVVDYSKMVATLSYANAPELRHNRVNA